MRAVSLNQLSIADAPAPAFIAAAAAAGFRHVGLRLGASAVPLTDDVIADPGLVRAIGRSCADNGVTVIDVDHFPLIPGIDFERIARVLDAAAAIGARFISASGLDPDGARQGDSLVRLCRLAAERGLTVGLEFMVYRRIRTLTAARAAIAEAGQPNLGLLLDPLHLDRSGGTVEEVAALPPGLVAYAQLCDAPAARPAPDALAQEAGRGRLLPGEGELPLRAFISALPPDMPVSVEVPDRAGSGLSPAERAVRAAAAARSFVRLSG
jgi:sugar phosphate isomerase/epimerase